MHPIIALQSPHRRPQWRLDRVAQMIGHRPDPIRPGRHDDHYIRVYRHVLLALAVASDDATKLGNVFRAHPHVCGAHRLHYSPDLERRQILEARLLTNETIEEIADHFGTAPQVIDYYEKLFFHVRDRLQCSGWIGMVIKNHRRSFRDRKHGEITDEQRGYAYRLFGYYGGPLVLDAAINGMVSTTVPQCGGDVSAWFDSALSQIVRTSAAAAATSVQLNQRNMMQLLRLTLRKKGARTAARASGPPQNFEAWAEEALAATR